MFSNYRHPNVQPPAAARSALHLPFFFDYTEGPLTTSCGCKASDVGVTERHCTAATSLLDCAALWMRASVFLGRHQFNGVEWTPCIPAASAVTKSHARRRGKAWSPEQLSELGE